MYNIFVNDFRVVPIVHNYVPFIDLLAFYTLNFLSVAVLLNRILIVW